MSLEQIAVATGSTDAFAAVCDDYHGPWMDEDYTPPDPAHLKSLLGHPLVLIGESDRATVIPFGRSLCRTREACWGIQPMAHSVFIAEAWLVYGGSVMPRRNLYNDVPEPSWNDRKDRAVLVQYSPGCEQVAFRMTGSVREIANKLKGAGCYNAVLLSEDEMTRYALVV